MNGSRRTHVKSRNGCAQCKKRRIKCDERPPCCGSCTKRGTRCDYEDLFKSNFSSSESIPVSRSQHLNISFEIDKLSYGTSSSASASRRPRNNAARAERQLYPNGLQRRPLATGLERPIGSGIQLVFPGLPHRDQALLHHYVMVTTHSITSDVERLSLWQNFIPSVAQTNDYVMHTLLGFSALHIAYMKPEGHRQYLTIATAHQCKAIAKFRANVDKVTLDNSNPVFIFSSLLILYELGLMHPIHQIGDGDWDPITKFIQSVKLIHNAVSSLRTVPWLRLRPVMKLLIEPAGEETPEVPSEVYQTLQQLEILNENTTLDQHERETYSAAILYLGISFEMVSISPKEWLPALRWANLVSPRYVETLREKRPMALIILVHFCLLVNHSPERWWMKGWTETIVNEVVQLLDEPWRPHLSWAISAMEPNKPLLHTSGVGIPGDGRFHPTKMSMREYGKPVMSQDLSNMPVSVSSKDNTLQYMAESLSP